MFQQYPLRLEFYIQYQKIIAEYNNGKDVHAVEKTFSDVKDFMQGMSKKNNAPPLKDWMKKRWLFLIC